MRTLTVDAANGRYDILFLTDLFFHIGHHLGAYRGKHVVIVADEHVAELYARQMLISLQANGIHASLFTLPVGEQTKSQTSLFLLYEHLYDLGITRTDALLALGGGVIGDVTGFAAATYSRGIDFIQVPTTLLAQVDSSVGGKTAINLSRGKNMVGAFYQPNKVLIDRNVLRTLDDRQLRAGLAEVIKTAAIADADLFEILEMAPTIHDLDFELVVERCCKVKSDYVVRDPKDQGVRLELNFGHTFGHAIEIVSDYSILHGEAVAIGMVAAAKWGECLSITPKAVTERLVTLIKKYQLPTKAEDYNLAELLAPMQRDKKSHGNHVRVVLIDAIGHARCKELTFDELSKLNQSVQHSVLGES